MSQRPTPSSSLDLPLSKTVFSDDDTEELPISLRVTESSSASPVPWKSSNRSSFFSSTGLRESTIEDTTRRWKKRKFTYKGEDEIRSIQTTAQEVKRNVQELRRKMRYKTEQVQHSSLSLHMQSNTLKDYVNTLGSRLDRLILDTEETEKDVKLLLMSRKEEEKEKCSLETKGKEVKCSCFL